MDYHKLHQEQKISADHVNWADGALHHQYLYFVPNCLQGKNTAVDMPVVYVVHRLSKLPHISVSDIPRMW